MAKARAATLVAENKLEEAEAKSQKNLVHPSTLKVIERIRSPKSGLNSSINQAFTARKAVKKTAEGESPGSPRNQKAWVAKSSLSPLTACCEVVGHEGIRLYSPRHQHKTRFWLNEEKLGVVSESIPGFTPLSKEHEGYVPGLGVSTLLALFFNETDLKLEHLDVKTGEKIDGDWMLSALQEKAFEKGSEITVAELNALPYVDKYNAKQWLDQIEKGRKNPYKKLMFADLSTDPRFRQEVNETILSILLTPDKVLKNLVGAYVLDEQIQTKIFNSLLVRKEQLQKAAFLNASFLSFITDKATSPAVERLQYLRSFVTSGKRPLIAEEDYPAIKHHVLEQQKLLRAAGNKALAELSVSPKSGLKGSGEKKTSFKKAGKF